jgi:peroxiredoxin
MFGQQRPHIDHRQIRFLADPDLRFTKALDGAAIFGGDRSKRYALVTEDGAVKDAHVEADNTGLKRMLLVIDLRCNF